MLLALIHESFSSGKSDFLLFYLEMFVGIVPIVTMKHNCVSKCVGRL